MVIDATLTSGNALRFRKDLLEKIYKLIMRICDKIRDWKLQSVLSSGKIDNYEFFTEENILPLDQSRIIERAKFTYFPLGKAFERQTKRIDEQGKNNRYYYKSKQKSGAFNQERWWP